MATLEAPTIALDARPSADHLQPLDSVLNALQDCTCTWCLGMLGLLRQHLEEYIPLEPVSAGQEVLN